MRSRSVIPHLLRTAAVALAATAVFSAAAMPAHAQQTAGDRAVPHYDHVFVILEENKGYGTVLDHGDAPHLAAMAAAYGTATQMYAETHPSEANYVALLGGDTFGIHDDDAWYCVPGSTRPYCGGAAAADYVAHLVAGPNLASQLRAKGLGWRAYLEDLPAPGSLAIFSPERANAPAQLYAAKHTGFTNFASVHDDADLDRELVGFDALHDDLRSGNVPAFALVVPNQCNEMHGLTGPKAPADCRDDASLVRRGDAFAAALVAEITASPVWTARNQQTAIVITWDENGPADRATGTQSCCVADAHNPGGGRIPTLVLTNHGPRRVTDATAYDHYSLLRTIEDALGLGEHLRHADDASVVPMTPLFGPLR